MNEQKAKRTPWVTWLHKFTCAGRGVMVALRTQSSCQVHALATLLVVAAGWWWQITAVEWLVIAACIVAVWTAELFNTSLELLARSITTEYQPQIRDALDISAGAVAIVCALAAAAGCWVFCW